MKRVTINGSFEDFETLDEALTHIREKWREGSFCNLRDFNQKNVITQMKK